MKCLRAQIFAILDPMGAWVFACLSGALLALAQPPLRLWPVAGVALVPWLITLARSARGAAVAGSFAVGFTYGLVVAAWIPAALETLGTSRGHAVLGLLLIAAWGKGIPFALVGALLHRVLHQPGWVRLLGAGLGFLAVEWVASSWRLGLPWALLGHSQEAVLSVAQLAVVGGVPFVSALLTAVNQSIALAWEARGSRATLRTLTALLTAWVATALLGIPLAERVRPESGGPTGGRTHLLLVQPDIPRGERWAPELQALNLERIARFTERALGEAGRAPDAVLWPENLLTAPIDSEVTLNAALHKAVNTLRVPLILGAVRSPLVAPAPHYRSSVVWMVPGEGIAASIDKTRAVPWIEASAGARSAALAHWAFGGAAAGPRVEEAAQTGVLRGAFPVTAVLCYEVLFPGLVAERRSLDSVAIVNLADDSWTESPLAREQLLAFARFRAIEQRLPLVRVAHGGISAVIDPFGRVVKRLPRDAYAYAMAEVGASDPPSLQEKTALVALPLATGLGVWWALGPWARRAGHAR